MLSQIIENNECLGTQKKPLLQTMQVGSYIQNASSTQLKPDNSKKGRKTNKQQQQPNAANKESS
jgi:hypothetical protein